MRFIQSIMYGSLILALVGCSSAKSTKVQITGVSRDRVANALWEAGSKIKSPHGKEKLIWPSVDKINKRKAVIKYEKSYMAQFSFTTSARDTIRFSEKEPDNILVSLRCEESNMFYSSLISAIFSSDYHRKEEREQEVLSQTVKKLEGNNVSVEWFYDD